MFPLPSTSPLKTKAKTAATNLFKTDIPFQGENTLAFRVALAPTALSGLYTNPYFYLGYGHIMSETLDMAPYFSAVVDSIYDTIP